MSSLYEIKPAFQRLLRPLCAALHRAGATPNQITAVTMAASLGMGVWLSVAQDPTPPLAVMPVFLLLRMAANALDGMIAKAYDLSTPAGAILNEVADVVSDLALYSPFAVLPGIRPMFPLAIAMLGATTEVAGLAAVSAGAARRHDGPMGKSDRALAFGILSVAYVAGLRSHVVLDACMAGIIALLVITLVNRCRRAVREAS